MSLDKDRTADTTVHRRPGRRVVTMPTAAVGTTTLSNGKKTGKKIRTMGVLPPSMPASKAPSNPFGGTAPATSGMVPTIGATALTMSEPKQPRKVNPFRERWETATDGIQSIHGRPFDPTRAYNEGDIILHKQHGMGIVECVTSAKDEIVVLFRESQETFEITP
ncbi:MAG: hypothetical protein HUU55_14390, partial [Myxococcales bacterium]|nr:hypothetical protein [Myxococcales bacterium]